MNIKAYIKTKNASSKETRRGKWRALLPTEKLWYTYYGGTINYTGLSSQHTIWICAAGSSPSRRHGWVVVSSDSNCPDVSGNYVTSCSWGENYNPGHLRMTYTVNNKTYYYDYTDLPYAGGMAGGMKWDSATGESAQYTTIEEALADLWGAQGG